MKKIPFILAFALVGLVCRVSATERGNFYKNYPAISNSNSKGASDETPVRGPVLQSNQAIRQIQEKLEIDSSDESRLLGAAVVKIPPSFIVGLVFAKGSAFCTGTLITKNRILTSWDCFKGHKKDKFVAVLGLSNISSQSRRKNRKNRKVSFVNFRRNHIEFETRLGNGNDRYYSLAIIKLRQDVKPIHKPIALAFDDTLYSEKLRTIGWGPKSCGEELDNVLREAEAEFFPVKRCRTFSTCVSLHSGGKKSSLMIGDGGAPLFSEKDTGNPVQIAVGTHAELKGKDCMNPSQEIPNIYINNANFTTFIRKHAPEATFVE